MTSFACTLYFFFFGSENLCRSLLARTRQRVIKEERGQLQTTSTRRVEALQRGTDRPPRGLRTEQRAHQKTAKPIWLGVPNSFQYFSPGDETERLLFVFTSFLLDILYVEFDFFFVQSCIEYEHFSDDLIDELKF